MSEYRRNIEWNWHQKYLEVKRNQDMCIHKARLDTLNELVLLLIRNQPKRDTFFDTYDHCVSNIKEVIDNLSDDINYLEIKND